MKVTFEFVLPEEEEELAIYNNAYKAHSTLLDYLEYLRSVLKYDCDLDQISSLSPKEIIEFVRSKLLEKIKENNLNIDIP